MRLLVLFFLISTLLYSQVRVSTAYNYPVNHPILKGLYSVRACTVGDDIDGDGKKELLVTNYTDDGHVHLFEFNGEDNLELVWSSPNVQDVDPLGLFVQGSYSSPMYAIFGDMDNDGLEEIIFQISANGFYFYEWDGVVGSDNYGTTPAYHIPNNMTMIFDDFDGFTGYFEVLDVDNDGYNELITPLNTLNNDYDAFYIISINFTFPGFAAAVQEKKILRSAYTSHGLDGSPYAMISANLDGIGNREILIHNWNYKNVTPLRVTAADTYEMASTTNNKQNIFLNPSQDDVALFGGLAYDIDGDGREEIYLPHFASDIQGLPNNRLVHMIHYEEGQSTSEIDASNVFALDFSALLTQDNVDIAGIGYGDIDNDSNPNLYFGVKNGGDSGSDPYYGPDIVTAEFQGGDKTDPTNWTYEILYEGNPSIYNKIINKDNSGTVEKEYHTNYAMVANFWGRNSDVDNDGKEDIVLVYQEILSTIDVEEQSFIDGSWVVTDNYTIPNDKRFTIRVLEYGESEPQVSTKIFLEGPYNSGSMSTSLNTNGDIPLEQPFNSAPWNYGGTESVTEIPNGVVDWVLVELVNKNDKTDVLKQRAAFILSNGDITDLDGSSALQFTAVEEDYYLVVKHRNHLGIMSSDPKHIYDYNIIEYTE